MTIANPNLMLAVGADFDAATILPPVPAAKLRSLREMRDAATDLANGVRGRAVEARDALADAKRQAALIFSHDPHAKFGKAPNMIVHLPRVDRSDAEAAAERRVAERHEEMTQIEARLHAAAARSATLRALIERLERYLVDGKSAGAMFEAHRAANAVRGRGPGRAAVDALRAEFAELQAERKGVEHAPKPLDEIRAAIVAEVNGLAARSEPKLDRVARPAKGRGAARIEWPQVYDAATRQRGGDAVGLVAWLGRDALIERLVETAAVRFGGDGLSDAERQARLAEIDGRLLELQRVEEAAIVAGEGAGLIIDRRPAADPRAVLGLADSAPAPKGDTL